MKTDSHYKITVKFKSGEKLEKEIGYITNGFDFKDTLIVKNDEISLESPSKN